MAFLAIRETVSQFDQAECCSLAKSKCCYCDITFDGNRHVTVRLCVVSHGKISGITTLVKLYAY